MVEKAILTSRNPRQKHKKSKTFRIGDKVVVDLGVNQALGTVVEDRGSIGSHGRKMVRVEICDGHPESIRSFDVPVEELSNYYPFRIQTAIGITAQLIKEAGKSKAISIKKLMKLLYIIERESIATTRKPVIGGSYRAMPEGPVPSEVYRLIRSSLLLKVPKPEKFEQWDEHFMRKGQTLALKKEPKASEFALSKSAEQLVRLVLTDFRGHSDKELTDLTHEYPEWVNAFGRRDQWIKPGDIIDALY